MSSPASEVRFARMERRGLLLGLTGPQIACLGAAISVAAAASMTGGAAGVLVCTPLWSVLVGCALLHAGGRPVVASVPSAARWAWRRLTRTHRYVDSPTPVGTVVPLRLPGVPGRLTLSADTSSGAAVIGFRRAGFSDAVTVVAEVRGRGFLLEEPAAQDRRVSAWGRLLASLGQTPEVAAVQVLHRCTPFATTGIRAWWTSRPTGRPWVSALVDDLVADTENAPGMQLLVAIRTRTCGRNDLDALLARLDDALEAAELDVVGWLTPSQVGTVIRLAYDPATRPPPGGAGAGAYGPMGVEEAWAYARGDCAFHATYWISEWPRSGTHASFLRPLLLGSDAQRCLSLLACSEPAGKALRQIRRQRAEQMADAAARARIGSVEDETHRAAAAELTRREQELVAGHGDLRFTGLLTVTAASLDELAVACAATEAAAARAGCDLRRLVGQQLQAHAAATLPLVWRPW